MLTGELSCSDLDFERHGSAADEKAPRNFFEKRRIIQQIKKGEYFAFFARKVLI